MEIGDKFIYNYEDEFKVEYIFGKNKKHKFIKPFSIYELVYYSRGRFSTSKKGGVKRIFISIFMKNLLGN